MVALMKRNLSSAEGGPRMGRYPDLYNHLFGQMRTTSFILSALVASSSVRLSAQTNVDCHKLGKEVVIIGQLGVPLGTIVEIEATVVAGRFIQSKEFMGVYLLRVTKVGSNSVSKPPTCPFRTHSCAEVKLAPDEFSLYELKKGKKTGSLSDSQVAELERGYVGRAYRLLVYEEGVYTGIPPDLPKDYPIWQGQSFGFRTHLIVLRIIEESGKPNPHGGATGRQP